MVLHNIGKSGVFERDIVSKLYINNHTIDMVKIKVFNRKYK